MAKSATVGALRVQLGLDSAQFTAGMKNAQTGLQRFASIAKQGALMVGAAMVAAGGAMAVMMKGVIDDADKMSKLSQSIGVPIDELSRLRYAADLAGVDLDSLGKAVKRLSAGMLDASQSATGPAARAFTMLGISVRDAAGNMRPASQVVEDLAGKFARMPDGAEKTALAMRIFGKSGADMIPLLNSGAEGLREMYAEAEELGIVLDAETGKAAERFNDNLTRMGKIKDGIVTKITAAMLPAMASLSDAMVVAAKDSQLLQGIGAGLGWTLKALATAAVTASGFFVALARDIAMAAEIAWKWAKQDYAGAAVALANGNAARERTLSGIQAINRAIWAPNTGGVDRPPAVEGLELVDRAAGGARRATERLTDAQREAARAAEELKREGERVFESTRTAAEQYAATVERLSRLLAAAAIDQDTFNRAMKAARQELDAATRVEVKVIPKSDPWLERQAEIAADLAADHRRNLEAATYDGIRGGLEAAADGDLGKYLAMRIRSALMDNLAGSLTDILMGSAPGKKGGGGLGAVLSGAMSFFGLGKPKVPGFKDGGTFKVGGSGGVDSQRMMFDATPGEMVDIRKPGQDRGGEMKVHVVPSPYFDLQVERVAGPIAQQAAGQMGRQVLDSTRRAAPGMQQRQTRLGTT